MCHLFQFKSWNVRSSVYERFLHFINSVCWSRCGWGEPNGSLFHCRQQTCKYNLPCPFPQNKIPITVTEQNKLKLDLTARLEGEHSELWVISGKLFQNHNPRNHFKGYCNLNLCSFVIYICQNMWHFLPTNITRTTMEFYLARRTINSSSLVHTCFTLSFFLTYSSTLKMEVICFSETSVDYQRTTLLYVPKDRILINTAFITSNPTSSQNLNA
jgi:hypothetical protein